MCRLTTKVEADAGRQRGPGGRHRQIGDFADRRIRPEVGGDQRDPAAVVVLNLQRHVAVHARGAAADVGQTGDALKALRQRLPSLLQRDDVIAHQAQLHRPFAAAVDEGNVFDAGGDAGDRGHGAAKLLLQIGGADLSVVLELDVDRPLVGLALAGPDDGECGLDRG